MIFHTRPLDQWTGSVIGADPVRENLAIYTWRKLQETLQLVTEGSVFYREHFREHLTWIDASGDETQMTSRETQILGGGAQMPGGGVQAPGDEARISGGWDAFRSRFEQLPFTTPEDLKERERDFLCVHPSQISRIVTLHTSGSTGRPKRVHFTQADQELTTDFFDHGMRLMADDRDTVLILMPARMPGSIGCLLGEGLRRFGAKTIEYGLPGREHIHEEMRQILQIMEEQSVTGVVALPTHMRMLAELARDKEISLQMVLLSAEYIPEADVRLIRETFGCRVYEHYGMTEMGLGCAVSCGAGAGYHIRETDLYLEIIDPATGAVIRDEKPGEIVFTTLTRRGMPFVRYRTGDISRWIHTPCPCGSILRRLDKVQARGIRKGLLTP